MSGEPVTQLKPAARANDDTRTAPLALSRDPLELLAAESRRFADVVESISRRSDVRALRARLLLVLLSLRCPVRSHPRRSWYVKGAVARVGIEGLRRVWRTTYGHQAPCARTLRAHLGALERALLIIRSPGDWVELGDFGRRDGWRPRQADTIHLLEDEDAALWWRAEGLALLDEHPRARTNPDSWRLVVGSWRGRKPSRQLMLFEPAANLERTPMDEYPEGLPDRVGEDRHKKLRLALGRMAADGEPLATMGALMAMGIKPDARSQWDLAADPERLEGAAALLLRALERGDSIRNPTGWILRAFRHTRRVELIAARDWMRRRGPTP